MLDASLHTDTWKLCDLLRFQSAGKTLAVPVGISVSSSIKWGHRWTSHGCHEE